VKGFLAGRHGMRLALDLPPMTPALARLPMKASAAGLTLSCSSCHAPHRYDTVRAAVEACLSCHDDGHSTAYLASPHYALWQRETGGKAEPGTGVSCATCHLPRERRREAGAEVVRVDHNQNHNLQPNEKMVRSVCLTCHGLGFSLDALADAALVAANFTGRPARHVQSIEMAADRAPRASSN
jgi:Zn-finger protein